MIRTADRWWRRAIPDRILEEIATEVILVITGKFRDGKVLPDEPVNFIDGTPARIVIGPPANDPVPGTPQAVLRWLETREPMSPEEVADWKQAMADVLAEREIDAERLDHQWKKEDQASEARSAGGGA